MDVEKLSNVIKQVEELTSKPEKYLSLQENEAEKIKVLTRNLYNFTKDNERRKNKNTDALQKLIIKNLDEEQIWQQIELQNNSICQKLVSDVAHLLGRKDNLKFPLKKETKKKLQSENSEAKTDKKADIEVKTTIKTAKKVKSPKVKSSIVDDKFFKLREMEKYLEKIERGEESDDNDDIEIDYFRDDSSSEADDNEMQLHYSNFFDQPEEEADTDSSEADNKNNKSKKVKFSLKGINDGNDDDGGVGDSDNDDEEVEDESWNSESSENNEILNFQDAKSVGDSDFEEGESNDEAENDNTQEEDEDDDEIFDNFNNSEKDPEEKPSSFEARQERLKARIQNLEEELLAEKPWQLKGEVTASNRPQNSLLEEYVEFDIATRPAPILTEKSTLKLEDVIIQRIKDKAWDDVVRKIKPVENEIEYKKKLVLDQEKSKLSLAQIYEQEYLKQLDNKNESVIEKPEMEAPEHQEIRIMMNKLFSKLDALSNFHFTPKQVAPEVKIISNLPAVNMEEVAPVTASDATLLAPEEVKSKSKGDLIGKTERTSTDKKRERRQKKLKQKIKYKQLEAKEKLKLQKSDSKNSQDKNVSQKFLQKITKSSNVIQLEKNGGGKYVKSSNAFFSKLQDETNSVVNKKNLDVNKMKSGKKVISKKFKSR